MTNDSRFRFIFNKPRIPVLHGLSKTATAKAAQSFCFCDEIEKAIAMPSVVTGMQTAFIIHRNANRCLTVFHQRVFEKIRIRGVELLDQVERKIKDLALVGSSVRHLAGCLDQRWTLRVDLDRERDIFFDGELMERAQVACLSGLHLNRNNALTLCNHIINLGIG